MQERKQEDGNLRYVVSPFGYLVCIVYFIIVQIVARWDWFILYVGGMDNMWKPLSALTIIFGVTLLRYGIR